MKLTYKKAKELKDAGFPVTHCTSGCPEVQCHFEDGLNPPTLSDLIEACGDDLSHIKKWGGYWWAVCHTIEDANGNNPEEQGKTPEEAVANLYLVINK